MSPPPQNQSRDSAETAQPNGEPVTAQPTPFPASNTPAAQSQSQTQPQSHIEPEPPSSRPDGPPPPYEYEYVTDSVLDKWSTTGKQKVVEEGTSARLQENLAGLASVYQELIRSAIYGRLSPSEAGNAVKEIIGANSRDIEMEGEEAKASPSVFDPRSLFLDTLSIITDSDTSNPSLKPLVFATSISPNLMRLQLDTPLLQSLGLVRETFARMGIRKQTNLLYRQSNYNLLREESEGYSKLLTELFATSSNEPPSSEVVEDTFERVKAMIGAFDMDVGRVLDVTLDVFAAVLVKQFRFFVKLLRVSSWWPKENETTREALHNFGLPNWALPGSAGWITTDEEQAAIMKSNEERDRIFWDRVREVGIQAFFEIGHKSVSEEERLQALAESNNLSEEEAATRTWIQHTGTLPPKGNRVAAQLLGFKLRFYASSIRSKDDVLPDTLIYLSALLIKVGFISLRDLYTHLWRPDETMDELKTEKMAEKAEREKAARPGGGINALMLAGALSDDTVPPPRLREDSRKATPSKDQEAEKQSAKTENDLPDPVEQKVLLLKSLLLIGAIPEALFIISKFPWLMEGFPELPDFIHRILHHSLSKVYSSLCPIPGKDIAGQRQIMSPDQSGLLKGQIRLAQPAAKRTLRWAKIDTDDENEGIAYRFYWDEWSNNIPICQSVDDVFALCSSFLNLSGHKIGKDASLLTKLARIGKDSLAKDTSEQNRTRWRDLCKRLLLPSVSLTKANPGVVNEVFDLLSFFPREIRYNMYAEWYSGQTSRLPDIKSAFDQARAETKDVLKRLSKTNTRPMARALAKIAYANPGIVINVAISQIESYENLIEVVVECARYFTNLGYDILTWSLINSLGQKGRSRVQEGGLLTSRWLNALSTFAGRAFKRYSIMDPTPLLQYVVEQLRRNNSTDLIVLEQMIVSMAGIITDNNFNDNQVQAMAGGEILRSQTILQLLDKRHESKTTSRRLIKSLTHTRLAGQLLVAIAQERLTCVYNESSSELKLLGNIFDEIHRILTQYLDLLRSNLSTEEFDSFVPDFAALVKEFGVQPEIAFWIRRASISKRISEIESSKLETESKEITESPSQPGDENQMDTADDGNETPKIDQTTAEMEMDVDKDEVTAAPLSSNPVMQDLIDNVKTALPIETWEVIGPHFYATFWQLDLYDVHVPGQSYDDEIGRLKKRIMTISNDRSDMSLAGSQRKDRDRKAVTDLRDRLLAENKSHLHKYGQTRSRLLKEKDQWFAGMRLKHDALNISLLEQCFIPRLLLSPLDAFFCFKMLKFLHSSGTPNFRTVGLLDQLFREQRLTALIFLCTSKEADNLGRFLNEVLRDLSRWHADKAVYEREAFGTKRDLPGFAKNVGPEGVPLAFLEFEDFRRLLYKWHRLFSVALKTCFNSGEYMHIRNAISVLKAVVQQFPAVNWIGRDMLQCVNTLSKNDERDDVKIPAASLIGDLNRREKKWMLPQAFNMFKTGSGPQPPADGKSGTPQSRTGTPNSLNASAPEFKPTTGQL
jgi:THO complex subunit 2